MDYEIECVARALYSVEDDAQVWELEPEIIREEFRHHARAALALLTQHRIDEHFKTQSAVYPYAA